MPVSLIYLEIKCLYSYLKGCSSVVEKYDVHLQLMFVPRPRVGPGPLYTGADLFLHDSVIKIILCMKSYCVDRRTCTEYRTC